MDNKHKKLVFLCGARDFHAMDWYRSAKNLYPDSEIIILTDLIAGEGFKKLINERDAVYKLIILDRFLFAGQSKIGNIWRNLLKAMIFPVQVFLLRRFSRQHKGAIYHAHSMYYLWLAWAGGVTYVGTPQGSDILIKPRKSFLYRIISIAALKAARFVTVDSKNMADGVSKLSGVDAVVIQNGVDLAAIDQSVKHIVKEHHVRTLITSMRGVTLLYRIEEIIRARNASKRFSDSSITLIYPFFESEYLEGIRFLLRNSDRDLGRVNREEMYSIFLNSKLVISIPSSDSSPRSVYEAIFCGAAVAVTYHPYIDCMPSCMKARIIIVDLSNDSWFEDALQSSNHIIRTAYLPSEEALNIYDQVRSFRMIDLLLNS